MLAEMELAKSCSMYFTQPHVYFAGDGIAPQEELRWSLGCADWQIHQVPDPHDGDCLSPQA